MYTLSSVSTQDIVNLPGIGVLPANFESNLFIPGQPYDIKVQDQSNPGIPESSFKGNKIFMNTISFKILDKYKDESMCEKYTSVKTCICIVSVQRSPDGFLDCITVTKIDTQGKSYVISENEAEKLENGLKTLKERFDKLSPRKCIVIEIGTDSKFLVGLREYGAHQFFVCISLCEYSNELFILYAHIKLSECQAKIKEINTSEMTSFEEIKKRLEGRNIMIDVDGTGSKPETNVVSSEKTKQEDADNGIGEDSTITDLFD